MFSSQLPALLVSCYLGVGSNDIPISLRGNTSPIYVIAFSPSGETLASAGVDKSVRVWNIKLQKEQISLRWPVETIRALAFSPDGKTLAGGSNDDRTVKLWDVATWKVRTAIKVDMIFPTCVAFAPNGAVLAFPAKEGVWLWEVQKERLYRQLKGHETSVNVLAFSPDGKLLATGSGDKYSGLEDKADPAEVKLWDVNTGQEVADLTKGIELRVDSLGFSSDGTKLLTYDNRTLKLWDVKKHTELVAIKGAWLQVAYSPNDRYIACLGITVVTLINPSTGKVITKIEVDRDPKCMAIAPDGKRIAIGYDKGALNILAVPGEPR